MSCVASDGASLIASYSTQARTSGVSGSPTVIINGAEIGGNSCASTDDCNAGESCVNDGSGGKVCMLGRDANSVKTSICAAFKNAPSVCSTSLSSTASASSGSC
jgi:hypothetical protein